VSGVEVILTYAFLESARGCTHVEIRIAKPKPKDRAFLEKVGADFQETITSEPARPVSADRFLTQPVHAH